MAEGYLWECVSCESRGTTPETVNHGLTCDDPGEYRRVTFELPDSVAEPMFRPPPDQPGRA